MHRALPLALLAWTGCARPTTPTPGTGETGHTALPPPVDIDTIEVTLDPYRMAPLTAVVWLAHPDLDPASVVEVELALSSDLPGCDPLGATWDPHDPAFETAFGLSDWDPAGGLALPVLGMCPDAEHTVALTLRTPDATFVAETVITTAPVAGVDGEVVTVALADSARMAPGWTWLGKRVYDEHGTLRWFGPEVLTRLDDGTFLAGIQRWNVLGRKLTGVTLPEPLQAHHDTIALPDGHLLICASTPETTIMKGGVERKSGNDLVIELDDVTGELVNSWDLRRFFDVDRETVSAEGSDWLHLNTLAYDPVADAIVVSGRYQGVAMLTRGGEHRDDPEAGKSLVWMLAPSMDWGLAGWDGSGPVDPRDALLTAVDARGRPYPKEVQYNLEAPGGPDDFHWPVGQHGLALERIDAGRLRVLLFDNQGSFLFDGPGTIANGVTFGRQGDLSNDRAQPPYSVLLEVEIDEEARTVREVFSYGEGRPDLYGSFNGGVARFPEVGTRLMISNGTDQHDPTNVLQPSVVEVAEDGTEVFELRIDGSRYSAYHGGRVDLLRPWSAAGDP
ncbi:MAG: aryl-sulfate sulfotransferase [Alphaproteobacteria bacterium]|nr:aryl-sulfate sulfotransferase [Alphaproteobacteria bacterium]MCB9695863.1 aryl-sulfate sulfotransferase [Alphaproteobacteria bacterium]